MIYGRGIFTENLPTQTSLLSVKNFFTIKSFSLYNPCHTQNTIFMNKNDPLFQSSWNVFKWMVIVVIIPLFSITVWLVTCVEKQQQHGMKSFFKPIMWLIRNNRLHLSISEGFHYSLFVFNPRDFEMLFGKAILKQPSKKRINTSNTGIRTACRHA